MGACTTLGISNQDALSENLENDPFLNSALQRFTCELYYRFSSFLAPLSVGLITSRHYLSECNKNGGDIILKREQCCYRFWSDRFLVWNWSHFMTYGKVFGESIINMYSMGACTTLGISNQDALSENLENDPFLNSALQRFTCELYYRFSSFLAPLSVGLITSKHYLSECNKNGGDNNSKEGAVLLLLLER